MSVVKLLKDHKGKPAGTVVDAVPFLAARDLIAAGIAEPANRPAAAVRSVKPDYPALLAAERAKVAALTAEVAALKKAAAAKPADKPAEKPAAEKQTKPADAPPKK
jgi:hypothetical protein